MYNSEQSCYSRYEHAPWYTEHSSDGTDEYLICGKSVSDFFFFLETHNKAGINDIPAGIGIAERTE